MLNILHNLARKIYSISEKLSPYFSIKIIANGNTIANKYVITLINVPKNLPIKISINPIAIPIASRINGATYVVSFFLIILKKIIIKREKDNILKIILSNISFSPQSKIILKTFHYNYLYIFL